MAGNGGSRYHALVREARRQILTDALRAAGGNRTRAAQALGLGRTHLQRLVGELGVDVPAPKRTPAWAKF